MVISSSVPAALVLETTSLNMYRPSPYLLASRMVVVAGLVFEASDHVVVRRAVHH